MLGEMFCPSGVKYIIATTSVTVSTEGKTAMAGGEFQTSGGRAMMFTFFIFITKTQHALSLLRFPLALVAYCFLY